MLKHYKAGFHFLSAKSPRHTPMKSQKKPCRTAVTYGESGFRTAVMHEESGWGGGPPSQILKTGELYITAAKRKHLIPLLNETHYYVYCM